MKARIAAHPIQSSTAIKMTCGIPTAISSGRAVPVGDATKERKITMGEETSSVKTQKAHKDETCVKGEGGAHWCERRASCAREHAAASRNARSR